ncbi:hypothetical protein [Hydrogenophaga palleronii]|uniref:hypothetical protein n=1 Tax=Hydrogenophaga palleronii TaxID=65655 RepID=UPI000AE49574|nr:hypothetical protein [Hydrogenophaga palleronii]
MRFLFVPLLTLALFVTGCSTTQEVTLTKPSFSKSIVSVAQVLEHDNSEEMNNHLLVALQKEGMVVKPTLPRGSSTSAQADVLVSYVDVWRWDVTMYMKNLTVKRLRRADRRLAGAGPMGRLGPAWFSRRQTGDGRPGGRGAGQGACRGQAAVNPRFSLFSPRCFCI